MGDTVPEAMLPDRVDCADPDCRVTVLGQTDLPDGECVRCRGGGD